VAEDFLTSWYGFGLLLELPVLVLLVLAIASVVGAAVVAVVILVATRPKRRCPACGEANQTAAPKCRYCGEWLND
jgi:hypothetical protein